MALSNPILAALIALSAAQPGPAPKKLFFLNDPPARVWCGYASEARFGAAADRIYSRDRLDSYEQGFVTYDGPVTSKVTFTIYAESGDWDLIDEYDLRTRPVVVTRTVKFAHQGEVVVRKGEMVDGKAVKLRLVSAKQPGGGQVGIDYLEYPDYEVIPVEDLPFMPLAKEMRQKSLSELCRPE